MKTSEVIQTLQWRYRLIPVTSNFWYQWDLISVKFHINENTNFIKFWYTLVFTVMYKIKIRITETWNKVIVTFTYFLFKGLVTLIHNLKEVWKFTDIVLRYKAKSLNHEIRSQGRKTSLLSNVGSYLLILRKMYVHILIEWCDIRQNHWIMKLSHSDVGLLVGQRSGHTPTYSERKEV